MKRYNRAEVLRHGAYVEWVKALEAEKQRDQLAEALRMAIEQNCEDEPIWLRNAEHAMQSLEGKG